MTVLAAVLLSLPSLAVAANLVSADRDPLQLIETDFKAGLLTRDEKSILQIQAIFHPDKMPMRFQTITSADDRVASRSATLAILDIRLHWDELSPATQTSVAEALTRRNTAFTYISPSGYFLLHYDTLGTHAVPKTDADSTGVPDFVEKCATYCDTSRTKHQALGFLDPPSDGFAGGDSLFDVYFEQMSYYGYAVPEAPGPQPWPDYSSYLVLHRNFLGFPPNTDPEGNQAGAAKATVAHELHHCVQFAYDAGEYAWYMELDATCMEDLVFDHVNDNYNYLDEFMSYPDTSLMKETIHMYASFIWGMFLTEQFDTTLLRAVWNGARYSTAYTSLSDSLLAYAGWTQDSAFIEFTKWNFATGGRDDNQHFAEAGEYPLVDLAALHSFYPVTNISSSSQPAGYAATYIQFFPSGSDKILRVSFNGADTRQWAAYAIKSTTFNSHEFIPMSLTAGTYAGYVDIPDFDSCYAVTLVAVNLSEFSTPASFTYAAELRSPHAVSTAITTDSGIYSGATRQFQYLVRNVAPLGDVYRIKATDNQLWVGAFTQDLFVASNDSQFISIPVSVPDGTPLNATSNLVFSAISKSDSTVADTARVTAITLLQRGDVAFDGGIDIADLTRLIDFLFLSQTPLQPELEAGNVDCFESVDITDLTWLINFLFAFGPPCPCNPY